MTATLRFVRADGTAEQHDTEENLVYVRLDQPPGDDPPTSFEPSITEAPTDWTKIEVLHGERAVKVIERRDWPVPKGNDFRNLAINVPHPFVRDVFEEGVEAAILAMEWVPEGSSIQWWWYVRDPEPNEAEVDARILENNRAAIAVTWPEVESWGHRRLSSESKLGAGLVVSESPAVQAILRKDHIRTATAAAKAEGLSWPGSWPKGD